MNSVKYLTQAYSQAPWRKQLQIIGLFLLGLVFTALVAGIYLNVTARAATIGREIFTMQGKIEDLQMANADLQTRLADITAASQMEKRARDMGFNSIEMDQSMYIVVPGYTGRPRAVLAPPPGPTRAISATLPPDYTESLFDWLWQHVISPSSRMLEAQP
jgi:cell division protein FtsL